MRLTPNALMLFAAGFGKRMGVLTLDRPKPLIHVNGRALIDHALALTHDQNLTIVVNAHYKSDQIIRHLAIYPDVKVITEAPDILETGGGLKNALPHLGGGSVFTLNTDAVWTGQNPLEELRAGWGEGEVDALALLVPRNCATGYIGKGDFDIDGAGRLTRGTGFVYTGAHIINTARLADIPQRVFSFNALWDILIDEGRFFGVLHEGGWCDVGRPESIPLAEALLRDV